MPDTITCYALSTQRRVSVTEAVIIPRKISIIPPQVFPTSRGKTAGAPPLCTDRTRCRYEIVIGGTQRRRKGNSISRRIRRQEKQKNFGRISKTVRHTSRMLHQFLQVKQDSKVIGKFTGMVSEGRGKPKLVVNIEVSKNGDLHKREESQNVLHFWSQEVKGISIIRGVR